MYGLTFRCFSHVSVEVFTRVYIWRLFHEGRFWPLAGKRAEKGRGPLCSSDSRNPGHSPLFLWANLGLENLPSATAAIIYFFFFSRKEAPWRHNFLGSTSVNVPFKLGTCFFVLRYSRCIVLYVTCIQHSDSQFWKVIFIYSYYKMLAIFPVLYNKTRTS